MSTRVFFDTTILVYMVAERDPRAEAAERLLASGGMISVQGLNEFAYVARKKLRMPWEDLQEALEAIRILCQPPIAVTIEIHEGGLRIAQRYGLQFYDAVLLAAALSADCTVFYSEDMQDGQRIDSLTIRNPFVTGKDV